MVPTLKQTKTRTIVSPRRPKIAKVVISQEIEMEALGKFQEKKEA